MPDPYVVVIGGANMDIAGRPSGKLIQHDSNIGKVSLSHGGVGRNIAHNLALLGVDVKLITAFGEDANGAALKAGCAEVGIDIQHSITVPDGSTSTYLFVLDETGDMTVAINDMAILDSLTREVLEERLDVINGADVVVADSNLPESTISWLAGTVIAPIFSDPISVAKAPKLKSSLGRLHTLKPNIYEAAALTGMRITDAASLEAAARMMLSTGLEQVFISHGAHGVHAASRDGTSVDLPTVPCKVVNATGAGDAMMSAIIWAQLQGFDLEDTARAGLAASAIAVESESTINPQMSSENVLARMKG